MKQKKKAARENYEIAMHWRTQTCIRLIWRIPYGQKKELFTYEI
jgi:hypothetical protein